MAKERESFIAEVDKMGEFERKSVVIGNDNRGPHQCTFICAHRARVDAAPVREATVFVRTQISVMREIVSAGRSLEALHDRKRYTAADCVGCMLEGL
jgi:hypothetical protein